MDHVTQDWLMSSLEVSGRGKLFCGHISNATNDDWSGVSRFMLILGTLIFEQCFLLNGQQISTSQTLQPLTMKHSSKWNLPSQVSSLERPLITERLLTLLIFNHKALFPRVMGESVYNIWPQSTFWHVTNWCHTQHNICVGARPKYCNKIMLEFY